MIINRRKQTNQCRHHIMRLGFLKPVRAAADSDIAPPSRRIPDIPGPSLLTLRVNTPAHNHLETLTGRIGRKNIFTAKTIAKKLYTRKKTYKTSRRQLAILPVSAKRITIFPATGQYPNPSFFSFHCKLCPAFTLTAPAPASSCSCS